MLFGRDLQDGGDGLHVGVDGVADHLRDELIDQDNGDVVSSQEAPAEPPTDLLYLILMLAYLNLCLFNIKVYLFIMFCLFCSATQPN